MCTFINFRYWMHLWTMGDNVEKQLIFMGTVPSCGSKTAQINEGGTPILSPKPEPNYNWAITVECCNL